jgi:hypothetical protein
MLRLARQGDEAATAYVRELMTRDGNVAWGGGELASEALGSLARKAAGDNIVFREALLKKCEHLRNEVAGPNPSPVERLLVERVVACWSYLYYLELVYGQNSTFGLSQGLYQQKVLDRAHGRFLSAVKALADVRRLALPALQVNIAKKQVNVVAGTTAVAGSQPGEATPTPAGPR